MEKKTMLAKFAYLLALSFWAITLLPIGFIHAGMIIAPSPVTQVETPTLEFHEVILNQPAPLVEGFDAFEIDNANDYIYYYFGGE